MISPAHIEPKDLERLPLKIHYGHRISFTARVTKQVRHGKRLLTDIKLHLTTGSHSINHLWVTEPAKKRRYSANEGKFVNLTGICKKYPYLKNGEQYYRLGTVRLQEYISKKNHKKEL